MNAILRRRVRQSASRPRQGNNAHLSGFVFRRNLFSARHDHVHADVADYLLKNGAQHNIFTAVAMGDVDAIRRLAEVSRDVMDKPMAIWEARRRPLHLAVRKKQREAIRVLLDLGAEIDGTDIEGLTPLDYAAFAADAESVEILKSRNAKINLPAAFALRRKDLVEAYLREDPECSNRDSGGDC